MTTFHQLSPALRAAVASGGGGPAAVRDLRAAQLSKHLLLIRHLLAQWPDAAGEPSAIMALLDRVRTEAPDVFRDVVGAPLVGAWAAIVTRAVRQGGADPADFRHLGALAGVACADAGLDGRVAVAVQDGLVVLPGLGAAVVPAPGPAEIVVAAGRVTVRSGTATVPVPDDPTAAGRDWLPVRRLRAEAAGLGFAPALDDLHPYRHGHHVPPANRLSAAEIKLWQATFENPGNCSPSGCRTGPRSCGWGSGPWCRWCGTTTPLAARRSGTPSASSG